MRARPVALTTALLLAAAGCSNADTGTTATTAAPGTTTAPGTSGPTSTVSADEFVPVDAPGVTDTAINVGSVTAQNNPLGGNYGELNAGIKAYFEMVNTRDGGIYKRELHLTSERDDAFANNQAEVQALLSQDNVFAAFVATILFTGADLLADAGMPTFGWNINPEWTGKDNLFGNVGALCFGCAGPGLPWLAQEIGATSVGILAYGVSDQSRLCGSGVRTSFETYLPDVPIGFFDDSLQFGVPDLSSQVAEMKAAGVDLVATCMDFNGVFTLAKEMDKQQLDAVQYLPNGYDHDFMAANGAFFEGDYVVTQFVAFEHEPQHPQVADFLEWIDTIGEDPSELAMMGWIAADQFVTGLRRAGPDFSQEAVIEALNGGIYDPDGLIQPIDWRYQHGDPATGPNNPVGCVSAVQVQGSAFVPVFDDNGPWNCFDDHEPGIPDTPLTLDEARPIIEAGAI